MNLRIWRLKLAIALVAVVFGTAGVAHAQCGPIDVVFVLDTTGSMGDVLGNVKAELPSIIDGIKAASGGDFRLGLLEFHNDVNVIADLASGNTAAVETAIKGLTASGGSNEPEASDEAVRTVVEGLKSAARAAGQQTGDFNGIFRPEADKIIILVTDARPGGFDDEYTVGTDDVDVANISKEAAGKGIHISAIFVPTSASTSVAPTVIAIMKTYATVSGGEFIQANSDGTGTASAINQIVATCGGATSAPGTIDLLVDPLELFLENGDSADVTLTNYRPGTDPKKVVYGTSELPGDSTVSFVARAPEVFGTALETMKVKIGPDTPAGSYIINITGTHDDGSIQSNYVLVNVDCTAPAILGTPGHQPQSAALRAGSVTKLAVVPSGTNSFKYQWYQGHTGTTDFPIAGATLSTYTPPPVVAKGSNEYWVRVTSPCGSTDSQTATVSALP